MMMKNSYMIVSVCQHVFMKKEGQTAQVQIVQLITHRAAKVNFSKSFANLNNPKKHFSKGIDKALVRRIITTSLLIAGTSRVLINVLILFAGF